MSTQKDDLVKYRLHRADETLADAKMLVQQERWHGASNRIYYAAFYIVSALLTKEDIKVKSHSGARQMLNLHFVKTGRLTTEFGEIFSDLFEDRQDSDYDDFASYTQEDVLPMLTDAERFINEIKKLLLE